MQTAQAPETQQADYLTWEEIRRAYPDQWVLLMDMQEDPEDEHTLGGVVVAHSTIKMEVLDAIPRDRVTHSGFFYTGTIRRRYPW